MTQLGCMADLWLFSHFTPAEKMRIQTMTRKPTYKKGEMLFGDKPRHDFRDTYGELNGSSRGYLLVVPSREVGRGRRRARCVITSCFQGYYLFITTFHPQGSSILACSSEV
jgi:hypothetical protein